MYGRTTPTTDTMLDRLQRSWGHQSDAFKRGYRDWLEQPDFRSGNPYPTTTSEFLDFNEGYAWAQTDYDYEVEKMR